LGNVVEGEDKGAGAPALRLIDFDFISVAMAVRDLVSITVAIGGGQMELKRAFLAAYLRGLSEPGEAALVEASVDALLVDCELGKLAQDRGALLKWSHGLSQAQEGGFPPAFVLDRLVLAHRIAARVRGDAAMMEFLASVGLERALEGVQGEMDLEIAREGRWYRAVEASDSWSAGAIIVMPLHDDEEGDNIELALHLNPETLAPELAKLHGDHSEAHFAWADNDAACAPASSSRHASGERQLKHASTGAVLAVSSALAVPMDEGRLVTVFFKIRGVAAARATAAHCVK